MSDDQATQLRRALAAIKELRARLESVERARTEPIAIVGLGCRFPGANSPEAFWELLQNGVDAITEVPADRWDVDALYDPDPTAPGKISTRWGGFLKDVDQFDPQFFGISPREAAYMDPQQRLLLEVAREALEDAGQTKEGLAGSRTGVFVGVHSHSFDYCLLQFADPAGMDAYTGTGTAHNVVSGRLSYLFDLQGPNVAVDTACSSSLVAVHLAVQSLRNGECNMALAGGVNLILSPEFTIAASRMHMLAPDGRCKAFDASADGFVRGEGCGAVVLKRLSDALADGDNVLAVIRGTATNQDGHTNGLTAPNGLSQRAVIRRALENAGVAASQISYVEAHGTGTPLGDPIEVEALAEVIGQPRPDGNVCVLGSVKTNVGHLEGAAGIAGLIKVVLALQNQAIPPHLHFKELNPHISLANTPFVIPVEGRAWPAGDQPRYAGLSSFGWSGTNAHVVVEEAPRSGDFSRQATTEVVTTSKPYLLPLSAHNPEALKTLARAYHQLLREAANNQLPITNNHSLHDICYTASLRRTHHEYRLAIAGRSRSELAGKLEAFLQDESRPGLSSGRKSSERQAGIVFAFPGQGSQWFGMAQGLLATEPVFREALERCEAAMRPLVDWSLTVELAANESQSRLKDIDVIQPTLFAIEVALAELWKSWGIKPDAVVGHSMGEVAAAHVAGALTLEDAARIICQRSKLLRRVSGKGAMAVVELSIEQARTALAGYEDRLSIAVSNSPRSTVLSGDPTALEEVLKALRVQNVFCRPVKVDVASHSPQMDPLRADLLKALEGLQPRPASTPIYSTVTDTASDGSTFDANYWTQNLRQPVLFSNAVRRLAKEGNTVFIEMSPHPILLSAIEGGGLGEVLTVASLRREEDEGAAMLGSVGALYAAGYAIDWRQLYPAGGRHVRLPRYPWQRKRFWVETARTGGAAGRALVMAGPGHPLIGQRLPDLAHLSNSHFWQNKLDGRFRKYLRDHELETGDSSLYAEMASTAATAVFDKRVCTVKEAIIHEPLSLLEKGEPETQLILTCEGDDAASFQIFSRDGEADPWKSCASGKISIWPFEPDWLYDLTWQARPRAVADKKFSGQGKWLILADRGSVGVALAKLLEAKGETCTLALSGETAVEQLLADSWRGIIYLGSLDVPPNSAMTSCEGALHLVQMLARREGAAKPRLWLITRGAQAVNSEPLALAQTPLWGLGRVIALEHPELWGGLIDLPSAATAGDATSLFDEIWESDGEDQVAFRDGVRYVARLMRSQEKPSETQPLTLRADATYLVTGGLGGVGLQVARWLVTNGARHLLLTGRTGLPERDEWGAIVPDSQFGRQIAAVRALEELGAMVTVAKADVADLGQMSALFERTAPPVRGVIHAAGVAATRPLVELNGESLRSILHPKVSGTWVLHQLTQATELDFFVMFSSGASVWGSQGLAHYAAANHFLDAMAHHRRALGLPALSVNWGWWAGDGMATDDLARFFTQVGLSAMQPEQAATAMGYLLETGAVQKVVAAIDWTTFKSIYEARRIRPLLEYIAIQTQETPETDKKKRRDTFTQRLQEAAPHERQELLLGYVREQVARVLGFNTSETLDVRQGFFKMGMDSIVTVQLRNRLETGLGCSLPPTVAFEYPTVEAMTNYLAEVLGLTSSATAERQAGPVAERGEGAKAKLDALSEDELIAMFDNELGAIDDLIKDAK